MQEIALGWSPHLLHLLKDLQGPLCHPAPSACTDHCVVSDHIRLESCKVQLPALLGDNTGMESMLAVLLRPTEELPSPSSYLRSKLDLPSPHMLIGAL